ncbi:hypothetical protein PL81_16865, partial [Streptomyces sp. RSD-27]
EGLDARLLLAARTALTLQYFTEELYERTRPDAPASPTQPAAHGPGGPHDPALPALAPLVRVTADALDAALRGGDFAEPLDRARALDLAHRTAHPSRHDAVLRAGLHLTHEALADHLRRSGAAHPGASDRTPPRG